MVLCAVYNCSNRSIRDSHVSYYNFPRIIENKGVKMKEVSISRRKEWLARLSRADLNDSNLKYRKVCSEHFIHGKPSSLLDVTNPDWAPSLKLGHSRYKADKVEAINRYTSFPKHVTVSSNDQKEQGRPKQITESNKNFDETTLIHHEEMNKSQEAAADIICDSNVYNTEDQMLENMVTCNEKDDCQLPLEKRDTEDTSDSEEEISEKSSENIFHLCKSSTSHDGIAFVKRKLEQASAQYEKAQKKKILYEQKCKLYEKQISALKEVLNNLQLINSFSDLT